MLGSGSSVDLDKLCWTAAGTWGAAACANSLNQVFEMRPDGLMKRTAGRPLPSGALSRRSALLFAACAGATGLAVLYERANPTTAALGASTVVLYAFVYTPLKRVSVLNTWLGAVVGALPPLMGWAAAAGSLQPGAFVLSGLLYFWQLPHFMALAYMHRADYAAGGYRMMPLVDATGRRTALVALRNSLYLLPLGFAACSLGVATPPFAFEAASLSLALSLGAAVFVRRPDTATARRLFLLSLVHLPVLQAALVAHRVPNTDEAKEAAPATLALWMSEKREELAAERSPSSAELVGLALPALSLNAPFPFLPLPTPRREVALDSIERHQS